MRAFDFSSIGLLPLDESADLQAYLTSEKGLIFLVAASSLPDDG